METKTCRISKEDKELLDKIKETDKKYDLQVEIIDSLIELYKFHEPYQKSEDTYLKIVKQGNKYFVQKKINLIKSAVFAIASTIIINQVMFKVDPNIAYESFVAGVATIVGYNGFQILNEKDNLEKVYIAEQAEEIFLNLTQDLGNKFAVLLTNISNYIAKYDEGENWQELSTKIFDIQKLYIESKKEKGELNKDFTKKEMDEILEYYLEDNNVLDSVIDDIRKVNSDENRQNEEPKRINIRI